MLHGDQVSPPSYTVEEAFGPFLRCYSARDRAADGFAFVATESLGRGQLDMAATYIEAALEADAGHVGARELREVLRSIRSGGGGEGGRCRRRVRDPCGAGRRRQRERGQGR